MASDIWSLGLSLLEISFGMYPIPPPDISNQIHLFGPQDLDNNLISLHPMTPVGTKQMSIFELLEYIVNEPVAELPKKIFSDNMRDFVERCMKKDPTERPDLSSLMVRRDTVRAPHKGLNSPKRFTNLISGSMSLILN